MKEAVPSTWLVFSNVVLLGQISLFLIEDVSMQVYSEHLATLPRPVQSFLCAGFRPQADSFVTSEQYY